MNNLKSLIQKSWKLAFSKTAIFTYLVFTGNGLSAFFAFVFTVIIVRHLSIADYGYFSAMYSFLLLISDLSDIGIGTSLSTFLPPMEATKDKLLSFLKTAFYFQLGIATILSLLLYFFSFIWGDILFHTRALDLLLKITVIGIFFSIVSNFFYYALSARQRFLRVSFFSAFGSLVRLGLLIFLIYFSVVNLTNSVILQSVNLFILFIVAFILLEFEFLKEKASLSHLKTLLSFTYLLGIARGLTALASRLDVLMIVALRGPTEAGIYAIASRVISIYPLLSGSFSTVIAPRLASTKDKNVLKDFMIKVTLATLAIIVTIIFLIFFANLFMVTLFGLKGSLAVSSFQFLLVSMIFFVGAVPAVAVSIYYLKKPHILTVNSIIQLILVVFGNLAFIPRFGRLGATYSLILAYGITFFLTTFLAFYYLKKHHAK